MTEQIPEGLLLTRDERAIWDNELPSLFQESVIDPEFELDTYGLAVATTQLAKVVAAGYISPEEHQRQIEEAKRQAIIEWLTEHKESYYQEPNGGITLIFRACWTLEEWLALKAGKGDEK